MLNDWRAAADSPVGTRSQLNPSSHTLSKSSRELDVHGLVLTASWQSGRQQRSVACFIYSP
ncbi:hypothetical protein IWW55_003405 [Coemansia sp. RSA 2706]|nr:hypothetical protein IWW55_003405 [Coemansia sp. RSA 2706]KAJ2373055.1 hypothetical protein H4S02_008993 [Coemansia sp. RSA 2611]